MYKVLAVLFLFMPYCCFSQNNTANTDNKFYYFGIGGCSYFNLQLNHVLSANNLHEINKQDVGYFLGMDYEKKRFGVNFELSLFPGILNKNNVKFTCFPLRLGVNASCYRARNINVLFNLNYNYSTFFSRIYYGSDSINANNLLASRSKMVELNHSSQCLGIQSIVRFGSKKTTIMKIGFDYGLFPTRWLSTGNSLLNFPKERIDKFYLEVSLPISIIKKTVEASEQ